MVKNHSSHTRQTSRASLIILIVLALLLMIGAVILVARLPEDESWQWAAQASSEQDSQLAGFACDAAEAQLLYPFLDGIIRLTPERVTYLDILGSERYAVDTDFSAPFVTQNNHWLLVADREGTGYLMLNDSGELYRGRLTGNAGGAAISDDGMVALIQDRQENTGIVTVLEAGTGRHLYDCHFPESGYVLSAAFTPDGSGFDVNIINTDGSAPFTVLKRFAASGQQRGQRLPDLAELHPLLLHDHAGNPVLCGYSSIAALDFSQDRLRWKHNYARVHAAAADEQAVWVLAQKNSHESVNLYRIDHDGQESELLPIGESVVGPVLRTDYIAVGSGSRVLLIDSHSGTLYRTENLSGNIIRLAFSDQGSLLIVTTNGVRRLPLES